MKKKILDPQNLALIVICISTNLTIGFIIASVKLPFYLDSIGTVLATAVGGLYIGILTGILSVIIGSLYTPTLWAYTLTAITIAVYTNVVKKIGFLTSLIPTILLGLGLGVVCAIVSAPITTYLWSGVSLSGADAITAFFNALGKNLLDSVIFGGLSTDPIDKTVTSIVCYEIIRRFPLKSLFQHKLEINNKLR